MVVAKAAQAEGLSIFGRDVPGYADPPPHPVPTGACEGQVDSVEPTGTAGKFVLEGWAFDRAHREPPDTIVVVDPDGRTVGVGIFGKSRRDIRERLGIKHKRIGWVAFAECLPGRLPGAGEDRHRGLLHHRRRGGPFAPK